ncbi:ABC transporter permease [Bifidobacterium cuniculi]|uniref:Multidrug ABC transporter permease n=1 Tax=Bifidobacterium cuniculi TaxID=1688 RepID=A0A087B3N0_9BIFI|nr:ABC transporter permease [Bifidobacterium cuniculi]KFI65630.1 multidrug ABC transporter permease [Bifidobacterium cuniculi]
MWTTFLNSLKVSLREKSAVFWLFCFPIILSTMFMGMFGNISQSYDLLTMKFAVVADDDYCKADAARAMLAAMQRTPLETCDTATSDDVDTGSDGLKDLLELTAVDSVAEATDLVNRDTEVRGYLEADGDGMLRMTVSRNTVSMANSPNTEPGLSVSLSVLDSALGVANRQGIVVTQLLERDGRLVQDPAFLASLQENPQVTREVTLTNFRPEETARYYYALLAMAALMAMTFAVTSVCTAQANLSALGMRRSMAPLAKWRQIAGGFLASWLCTFLALLVALAYILFVCKVSVGGRYAASVLAIAVASFTATALGTFLGALPKLGMNTKVSLTTTLSCGLSLFSGLYGSQAMLLSDTIQRDLPWLAAINPTQQVTNLFYDILYYDSYAPFLRTVGILLAMAAIALAGATFFLRRQRYEHL